MVFKKTTQVLLLCSVALPFHAPASAMPVQPEQTFANSRVQTADSSARQGQQVNSAARPADSSRRQGRVRQTKYAAAPVLVDIHSVSDRAYWDRPAKKTRKGRPPRQIINCYGSRRIECRTEICLGRALEEDWRSMGGESKERSPNRAPRKMRPARETRQLIECLERTA